jgi:uncharacterized cupredoxin-like copper-binding protein
MISAVCVLANLGCAGLPALHARAPLAVPVQMRGQADPPAGGTDGAPGKASAVTRTIRIEAHDMSFSPSTIGIHSGETARIVIFNRGKLRHEFVIASHAEHLEHRAAMRRKPDMDMGMEPNAVTIDPGRSEELV